MAILQRLTSRRTISEKALLESFNLLTYKPTIYAANVAEDDLADDAASNAYVAQVREFAQKEGSEVFVICAQIEQEIAELEDDEKKEFLEDLGLSESGLDKLISASYSLLGLISYLTTGPDESRAWTIERGTKAPQAAGKIHTDFERGFIRAEVVSYDNLVEQGSYNAAKEKDSSAPKVRITLYRMAMSYCSDSTSKTNASGSVARNKCRIRKAASVLANKRKENSVWLRTFDFPI